MLETVLNQARDLAKSALSTITAPKKFELEVAETTLNQGLDLVLSGDETVRDVVVHLDTDGIHLQFAYRKLIWIKVALHLQVGAVLNAQKQEIRCHVVGHPVLWSENFFSNLLLSLGRVILWGLLDIDPMGNLLKPGNFPGVFMKNHTLVLDLNSSAFEAAIGPWRHAKLLLNAVTVDSVRCEPEKLVLVLDTFPDTSQAAGSATLQA